MQATIPHLTRSSLRRLLQRHDTSRLPSLDGEKPKKVLKAHSVGYVHIDIAEGRTEEGMLYMFAAIDRVSKFAYAELREKAKRRTADDFPRRLIDLLPFKVHKVLTDIDHRLTKPNHPWTNGQIERMAARSKRRLSGASTTTALANFLDAYIFGKHFKSLGVLTPFERIYNPWTDEPQIFTLLHFRLNI